MTQKSEPQFDCIIIGAGLAGLVAAQDLHAAGKSILVLEAAARAGGRVWSADFADTHTKVDWGAEWIIPTMHHQVTQILQDANIALTEEELTTPTTWQTASGTLQASYDELKTQNTDLAKALNNIRRDAVAFLQHQNFDIAPEQPLRLYLTERAKNAAVAELLEAAIFPLTGAAPEDVSTRMLWLEIGYHGGSIDDTLNAKACRIPKGCGTLATQLLSSFAERVVFNSPATHISRYENHFAIKTAHNTFTATHCIVAVPLRTLQTITFHPALPPDMVTTAQHSNAGRVAKAWALISSEQPPSEIFSTQSPIRYGYGRQLEDQYWLVCGQILQSDTNPITTTQCRELFQAHWPEAIIHEVKLVDWPTEPWAQASWHSSRAGWSEKTSLFNTAQGNLHFAGGDIAPKWAGWMEGALLSGRDVAKNILAASGK